jgi:hypothetical protein
MAVVNDLGYFLSAVVSSNSKLLGVPIRLSEIPTLLLNPTDPSERAGIGAAAPVAGEAPPPAAALAVEPGRAAPVAEAAWSEGGAESESEEAPVSVELVPRALLGAKSVEDAALLSTAWAQRAAALCLPPAAIEPMGLLRRQPTAAAT